MTIRLWLVISHLKKSQLYRILHFVKYFKFLMANRRNCETALKEAMFLIGSQIFNCLSKAYREKLSLAGTTSYNTYVLQ